LLDIGGLENLDILAKAVKVLLARVAPGVNVLSVERQPDDATNPEFQLRFVMRLDLSAFGGPYDAKVGAMFAVSSQRARLEPA